MCVAPPPPPSHARQECSLASSASVAAASAAPAPVGCCTTESLRRSGLLCGGFVSRALTPRAAASISLLFSPQLWLQQTEPARLAPFPHRRPTHLQVIVTRLLDYVRTSSDAVIKGETVGRIAELAERYAPSNAWFIRTMDTLFELEGDLMKPAQAHNLMRLIAEGGGEDDEEAESELRASACASYIELLRKPKLNALLLQVIFWVLGEYGATSGGIDPAQLIVEIVSAVETQPAAMASHEVQGYAITALAKVVVHTGCPLGPAAESFAQRLSRSRSTDLQQRSAELRVRAACCGCTRGCRAGARAAVGCNWCTHSAHFFLPLPHPLPMGRPSLHSTGASRCRPFRRTLRVRTSRCVIDDR